MSLYSLERPNIRMMLDNILKCLEFFISWKLSKRSFSPLTSISGSANCACICLSKRTDSQVFWPVQKYQIEALPTSVENVANRQRIQRNQGQQD